MAIRNSSLVAIGRIASMNADGHGDRYEMGTCHGGGWLENRFEPQQ